MNDICKDYLMHSWGKTPERKQLEQNYNADYYSKNKLKWVINRQKRRNATLPPEPERPIGLNSPGVITSGTLEYIPNGEGYDSFNQYAKRGFIRMWNVLSTPVKVIKKVPSAVKKLVNHKIFGAPVRLVGKSDFGNNVKKVFSAIKKSSNKTSFKSFIDKYF